MSGPRACVYIRKDQRETMDAAGLSVRDVWWLGIQAAREAGLDFRWRFNQAVERVGSALGELESALAIIESIPPQLRGLRYDPDTGTAYDPAKPGELPFHRDALVVPLCRILLLVAEADAKVNNIAEIKALLRKLEDD